VRDGRGSLGCKPGSIHSSCVCVRNTAQGGVAVFLALGATSALPEVATCTHSVHGAPHHVSRAGCTCRDTRHASGHPGTSTLRTACFPAPQLNPFNPFLAVAPPRAAPMGRKKGSKKDPAGGEGEGEGYLKYLSSGESPEETASRELRVLPLPEGSPGAPPVHPPVCPHPLHASSCFFSEQVWAGPGCGYLAAAGR